MEPVKRDILKKDPLPTIETTYATIRREVSRLNILKLSPSDSDSTEIGVGLAAKDLTQRVKFRPKEKRRQIKIILHPLPNEKTHQRAMFQTCWLPRVVGRQS